MNDNTRRQWDAYQERCVPCPDCAWLLYHLVADHSAAEGITRPGWQRLMDRCRRSRAWISTHMKHLERGQHIILASEGRWQGRQASEYTIPWLHDVVVRIQTTTQTTTQTTSSPKGERAGGGRFAPAPAAQHTADATDDACCDGHGWRWRPAVGQYPCPVCNSGGIEVTHER